MTEQDVKIDVHEIMQHLREVGGTAQFLLSWNGTGRLSVGHGSDMTWGIFPDFVLKFRKLKVEVATERFVKAAFKCSRDHDGPDYATCPQLLCDCDACLEYRDALLCLRKLRADHE